MSKPIDDGGPAFPRPQSTDPYSGERYWVQDGMSLREHYAGIALPQCLEDANRLSRQTLDSLGLESHEQAAARMAFAAADAMIAESRKERE